MNIRMGKGFSIPNFLGGINEGLDEAIIKVNEARAGQNINIDDGNLNSGKGYNVFTTAVLPNALDTIMAYYRNNVGTLIVASNGKLYKLSGSSFVELGSGFTSNKFDSLNFKVASDDVMILTNGVDNVKILNGDTLSDLKNRSVVKNASGVITGYIDGNGVTVATENLVTTLAPKMDFIELHYERIWGAKGSVLYFSTANIDGFDPADWTAPTTPETEVNEHGGEIECYTNDGGTIIGLKVLYDDIIVFKNRNIFKIFGSSPENYTKIQIFSSNGAIADKSIVATNVGAFFLNKDNIYQFDGTNVKAIGEKIKKTYKTLNKNYIQNSVAVFFENKYIVAVPEGSSTVNNLIIEYDTLKGTFIFKRGFEVSSFVEFTDKLLFTNSQGKIFEYNGADDLNGQPILSFYETGKSDMQTPDSIKDVEYIYFTGSGNGDIKISLTTERGTKDKTVTLGSEAKIYKVPLRNKGRLLNYRFENVNGSKFTIKSPKIILELDED